MSFHQHYCLHPQCVVVKISGRGYFRKLLFWKGFVFTKSCRHSAEFPRTLPPTPRNSDIVREHGVLAKARKLTLTSCRRLLCLHLAASQHQLGQGGDRCFHPSRCRSRVGLCGVTYCKQTPQINTYTTYSEHNCTRCNRKCRETNGP